MFGLGPTELLLILIIALIIFGPSKLPEIGKSILRAVVQFRQTSQEIEEEVKKGITEPLTGDLKKASQELEEEVKEVTEPLEPLTGDLKKTSQELEEEVKKGLTEPSEKEKKRDNSSNAKKRTKRL